MNTFKEKIPLAKQETSLILLEMISLRLEATPDRNKQPSSC